MLHRGVPVWDCQKLCVANDVWRVGLHRAWCREFCRSSADGTGPDGSRRHDGRANHHVTRTAQHQTGTEVTTLGRLITRRSQVQILPPPPTRIADQARCESAGPVAFADRVVPKMVPYVVDLVVDVVPYNPMVVRSGHAARHVRVVVSRLLPSRVVLYRESTARAARTSHVAEIASGR